MLERTIKVGSSVLSRFLALTRREDMALDISLVSVGAVLLIMLLLMVLICTSSQSKETVQRDHKRGKSTASCKWY